MKRILSMLCAVALLLALVPVASLSVSADTRARKTLYQEILERDGFIEGVWYPWFTHDNLGCGLTANETAAKYITNEWYSFNKVGIDAYGANKIYAEIYNLKAMGYNMLAYAGSAYGEGVVYDNNGDVLGIKEDYLANIRRFLSICRDVGMPVMWNICFHSSSIPDYYGMDAWNMICRMYGENTVADHYAQRFVKPLCKVLGEFDDVVALIALTDEIENEINDPDISHAGDNKAFGATKEDIHYFVNAMNDAVKATVPQIARTIAANSDDLGMYADMEVDVLGRNRYSDEGTVPGISEMYATAPMLLTEYNLYAASGMSESDYSDIQIKFRNEMKRVGYQGGFHWCWQPNASGGVHDLLVRGATSTTDFRPFMYDRYYYTLDATAKYRGESTVLDTPALFYHTGNGLLEWIPSRQAQTVTIESSTDGGKKWQTVVSNTSQSALVKNGKCVYQVHNASPLAIYRITVKDGKGNTASAVTNRAGAAADYVGDKKTVSVSKFNRPAVAKATVPFSDTATLSLTSFGTNLNRPYTESMDVIHNGSFEQNGGGQWNFSSFLSSAVQVVDDPTAPDGDKSLHFDTRGINTPKWYTFTVAVRPYTNYTLSAWVKGAHIDDDNRFYGSFGVLNPATKTFAVYDAYKNKRSRQDQQIYPTAWDNDWHLRSVTFSSGNRTEVVLGLYGCSTEMWLDDIALFQQSGGATYLSPTDKGVIPFSYDYEYMFCDPAKSVTENVRFDNAKSDYWQSGSGWDNGFMSIADNGYGYGKSLKYTASDTPAGVSYIKWIDVKPHTEYVVTFNYKVLKEGNGLIRLAVERGAGVSPFVTLDSLGAGMYEDEYGWCTFSTKMDTNVFDKIALVITDLGGEALIDNFRVFLPEDGSAVSDRPGGGGGSGTQGSVVRPTTTTTTGTAPHSTAPTTSASVTPPVAEPTATEDMGGVQDTTVTVESSTAPTQTGTVTTIPDAGGRLTDTTPDNADDFPLLWVCVGIAGGILLIAGGIIAVILWRKKKKSAE